MERAGIDVRGTSIGVRAGQTRDYRIVFNQIPGRTDDARDDDRTSRDNARSAEGDIRASRANGAGQGQRAATGVVGNGERVVELDRGGNRVQAGRAAQLIDGHGAIRVIQDQEAVRAAGQRITWGRWRL